MEILETAFMQRALIAAVLVGITAPAIGIYLVQRRQALMGDGIGHVAMTGVGLGFLLSTSPVWMATVVSVVGAVAMELIRAYGRTRGDIALAMLFYGGMAGGVLLINISDTGSNGQSQLVPLRLAVHGLRRRTSPRSRCSPPSWCWSRWGCGGSCSPSARTRSSRG